MNRLALPEERGADLRPEPPTLNELRRAHDWRTEERADGRYIVDVCKQCGYEHPAARRGCPPDCETREVPSRLVALAKRHHLLTRDEQRARGLDGWRSFRSGRD